MSNNEAYSSKFTLMSLGKIILTNILEQLGLQILNKSIMKNRAIQTRSKELIFKYCILFLILLKVMRNNLNK